MVHYFIQDQTCTLLLRSKLKYCTIMESNTKFLLQDCLQGENRLSFAIFIPPKPFPLIVKASSLSFTTLLPAGQGQNFVGNKLFYVCQDRRRPSFQAIKCEHFFQLKSKGDFFFTNSNKTRKKLCFQPSLLPSMSAFITSKFGLLLCLSHLHLYITLLGNQISVSECSF